MVTSMDWPIENTLVLDCGRVELRTRTYSNTLIEEHYSHLYPELAKLDPPGGTCIAPMFYSIYLKEPVLHIGVCNVYNNKGDEVEIGIRIFVKEYWNKGYGTDVINDMCQNIFDVYAGIKSIVLKTPVYNLRSLRCYQKCGFIKDHVADIDGITMIYLRRKRR
jgi:RimJ/RimL family protein N-acetyltransferase